MSVYTVMRAHISALPCPINLTELDTKPLIAWNYKHKCHRRHNTCIDSANKRVVGLNADDVGDRRDIELCRNARNDALLYTQQATTDRST